MPASICVYIDTTPTNTTTYMYHSLYTIIIHQYSCPNTTPLHPQSSHPTHHTLVLSPPLANHLFPMPRVSLCPGLPHPHQHSRGSHTLDILQLLHRTYKKAPRKCHGVLRNRPRRQGPPRDQQHPAAGEDQVVGALGGQELGGWGVQGWLYACQELGVRVEVSCWGAVQVGVGEGRG